MDLILNRLCDTAEPFTKPYNKMCAYPINQKANRMLFAFTDPIHPDPPETIDAVISMAADSKIAVVFFLCKERDKKYIREKMRERLYTELDVGDMGVPEYKGGLYFGQFNFGLIYDFD